MAEQWSEAELSELTKYFNQNITMMTLYQRVYKLNPNRSYEAVARKVRHWVAEGRTRSKEEALKKLRVGYLDIETTDFDGDRGTILTWYIKKRGKREYDFSVITKEELFNYEFDKRVVAELLEALHKYDVLYGHWFVDRRFDIPFIRTRAYINGLEDMLPDRMEKFILDTWPIVRNKLKLHSNSLDSTAKMLGIKFVQKTHFDIQLWKLASYGDPESLELVRIHNKRDVQVLEAVHKRIEKIENKIYRSM